MDPHDPFLEKISFFYLLSIIFSIIVAWSLLYFPKKINLIERVSFLLDDKPWLAGSYVPVPIIGSHYFGDFQSMRVWTLISTPYLAIYPERSNLLPSSRIFLYPYFSLPLKIAFVIYIVTTLGLLVFTTKKCLEFISARSNHYPSIYSLSFFCLLVFGFSRPLLMDLDRGNFYTISICLLLLAIIYFLSNRLIVGFILFLVAISLKSFLIFAILFFIVGYCLWFR